MGVEGNRLFKAELNFSDPDGTVDITKRGFTDHEHLDNMQLIHMNGRMYDYNNGRFLSVDPFIQAPTSTQSLNPYTYILNNPLAGIDPTGYRWQIILIHALKRGERLVRRSYWKLTRSRAPQNTGSSQPNSNPGSDVPTMTPMPFPGDPPDMPTMTGSPPITDNSIEIETLVPTDNPSSNSTANPEVYNGEQNSNQGTVLNENKSGDTAETESKPKDRSAAKRRAAREAQRKAGMIVSQPGENKQNPSGENQPRHQVKTGSDGQTTAVVDGATDTNHDEDHIEAGDVKEAEPVNKHNQPRLKNGKSKVEFDPNEKIDQGV